MFYSKSLRRHCEPGHLRLWCSMLLPFVIFLWAMSARFETVVEKLGVVHLLCGSFLLAQPNPNPTDAKILAHDLGQGYDWNAHDCGCCCIKGQHVCPLWE